MWTAASTVIIFVRHGQTTTNARRLLVGRSDPELTELGVRQARALVPFLRDVKEVWTSPLRRARDTARIAVPHLEATIKEPFIEVDYGALEGQPVSALSDELWERDHDVALGGGESLASVDARVWRELDSLLSDATSLLHRADEHLAIVSHVSPIKSATLWALAASPSTVWRLRLDNGSLTTLGVRGTGPLLVHFNMVPTLVPLA
jgi:probable phosphoglycerate mutase